MTTTKKPPTTLAAHEAGLSALAAAGWTEMAAKYGDVPTAGFDNVLHRARSLAALTPTQESETP